MEQELEKVESRCGTVELMQEATEMLEHLELHTNSDVVRCDTADLLKSVDLISHRMSDVSPDGQIGECDTR